MEDVLISFVLPVQAWSQFAARVEDFAQPENLESALSCLNLLVTDALRHVPDVIAYLSRLHNQSVFNFCAIPQVKTDLSPMLMVLFRFLKRKCSLDFPPLDRMSFHF